MIHATIKTVEIKKKKDGGKGICICIVTDENVWVRDWIGEGAPAKVSDKWWLATGNQPQGWIGFLSPASHDLVGCGVSVTLKDSDYGPQVDEVFSLDSGVQDPEETEQVPDDDEIPF